MLTVREGTVFARMAKLLPHTHVSACESHSLRNSLTNELPILRTILLGATVSVIKVLILCRHGPDCQRF